LQRCGNTFIKVTNYFSTCFLVIPWLELKVFILQMFDLLRLHFDCTT
jgi:hypothetical protein